MEDLDLGDRDVDGGAERRECSDVVSEGIEYRTHDVS